MISRRK